MACAHWTDIASIDVDGDGRDEVPIDPCGAPFPAGSYDEVTIVFPHNAGFLIAEIGPVVDWDLFACSTNGETIDSGQLKEGCAGRWTGVPGCREFVGVPSSVGTVIIRAYNFADPFPAPAWFTMYY